MGVVAHGVVVVGGHKVAYVLDHIHSGFQTGLGLGGVGRGQDADDLAGQRGVGVGRAGVKALGVNHLAVGLFGGLVQGGVGHVITVGGDEGQRLLVRAESQFLGHIGGNVGDQAGSQYLGGNRISFHDCFPPSVTVSGRCRWPFSPA